MHTLHVFSRSLSAVQRARDGYAEEDAAHSSAEKHPHDVRSRGLYTENGGTTHGNNPYNDGFISGVKSLFTGEDATTGTLSNDLADLGLIQDEAHYYEHQYQAGHAIIAVRGNTLGLFLAVL